MGTASARTLLTTSSVLRLLNWSNCCCVMGGRTAFMGRGGCGCSGGSAALFISELVMLAIRCSGLAAVASSSGAAEAAAAAAAAAAAECMKKPAGWRPDSGPGPGPAAVLPPPPPPPDAGGAQPGLETAVAAGQTSTSTQRRNVGIF